MSLRAQLLTFALLTLVLPWSGYRLVREMEAALRDGLEQAVLASAGTVATALRTQGELLMRPADLRPAPPPVAPPTVDDGIRRARGATVYATALSAAPRIDGVADDWSGDDAYPITFGAGHSARLAVHDERYAFVAVTIRDADIVYEGAPAENVFGDRVLLALEPNPGRTQLYMLGTRAPGAFRVRRTQPPLFGATAVFEDRIQAHWHETGDGFSIEARIPFDLVGAAIGVALIDVDRQDSGFAVSVESTWDLESEAPGAFVHPEPALSRRVNAYVQGGDRFRVVDREGFMLSDTGTVVAGAAPEAVTETLAGALFGYLLRREDPAYETLEAPPGRLADPVLRAALGGEPAWAWYRGGPERGATVVAAAPIEVGDRVLGAVLLEQRSDPILTLTNRALLQLMSFTLLATVVAAVGLLGYATWLSLRVRRLARAAETALGPKGEIAAALPGRRARDELGDLSRSFANLLERLREHNEYLRTLAGKLSHELRTPLAVVSTSLDNLEHEPMPPSAAPYLSRLRDGTARLDAILAAMSEATRIEQAIGDTEPQRFDLAAVVEACGQAFADLYPERAVTVNVEATRVEAVGSGELVAQLLDKLVDNAVSFSGRGAAVEIALLDCGSEAELVVANEGAPLPEAMRERLFDSLVSVRSAEHDGRPHLGLGLHIVSLIAEFHGASVSADNLPDRSGAVFRVRFPKV